MLSPLPLQRSCPSLDIVITLGPSLGCEIKTVISKSGTRDEFSQLSMFQVLDDLVFAHLILYNNLTNFLYIQP